MTGEHHAEALEDVEAATAAVSDAVLLADLATAFAKSAAQDAVDHAGSIVQQSTLEASNAVVAAWQAIKEAGKVASKGHATYLHVAHALDLARDPDAWQPRQPED